MLAAVAHGALLAFGLILPLGLDTVTVIMWGTALYLARELLA